MKKLIPIIFMLVLFTPKMTKAQNWIRNLTVIPSILTTSNSVQVIADKKIPSAPCQLITSSISISGYTIDIYSTHNMGNALVICSVTDTVTIGTLQSGSYCLLYHLIGQNSTHTYTLDIDTICFSVEEATGLAEYSLTNKNFEIYPNPTASTFIIKPLLDSFKKFDVEIFNLYGQTLTTLKQIDSKTQIDIADLSNGTYILVITEGNIKQRSKIFKNSLSNYSN